MLWKWKSLLWLPRLEKLSKSSITSWVLFHGIFMTSCDKILNQDVLTRNRCHQGATSSCGTFLALVCQEPLSKMSAVPPAHSVSSAILVPRVKKWSPDEWTRNDFSPPFRELGSCHPFYFPHAPSFLWVMMPWRLHDISCHVMSPWLSVQGHRHVTASPVFLGFNPDF